MTRPAIPFVRATLVLLMLAVAGFARGEETLQQQLEALRQVGPDGVGHEAAARAWAEVARVDVDKLPVLLAALDDANPLAANWIRTAIDAVTERQLRETGTLPAGPLAEFIDDRSHDGRARRLAYELLVRIDPKTPDRLLPGMLDDPSLELRRDAVARLIASAEGQTDPAPLLRNALTAARDSDQIRGLARRLRELNQPVDLARHFGFLLRWKIIGPFDNVGEKGYAVAYPPEKQVDLEATHPGKNGPVRWIDHVSTHDHGAVNLNVPLGERKGVIAYARAVFVSDEARQVQLRTTTFNAVKLWLNGELVDEHLVYHGGSQLDQYVCTVTLKAGENEILLKVCQNEQTQSWAVKWGYQLRVCDSLGGAVLSTDR